MPSEADMKLAGEKFMRFNIAAIALVVLLISCAKPSAPVPKEAATGPEAPPSISRADWEQKWQAALAEAKKEGSLSVYTLWRPETRIALTRALKEKYSINLELTPFGRGAELLAKVKAEQRSGLYAADVFGAGGSTLLITMRPEGLLGSVRPLLVLPEVLNPDLYREKKIPFQDEEGMALSLVNQVIRTVVYNTNFIKEGEITSYKDLLKPQYKGKITLNDPSVTGPGNAAISHIGHDLWGEKETVEFLRRFIKEQEVVIQRDHRLHMESVARGKYAIGLGPLTEMVAEFASLGSPIKFANVKEDNRMTAGAGALGVPTRFAHPKAALVFINWLLTREGQAIFARSFGNPSVRVDVSPEGIDPLLIPLPGEKYYQVTEKALKARGLWMEISKKIMEESTR